MPATSPAEVADPVRGETRRLTWAWLVSLVLVFGGATLWTALSGRPNAARIFGIIFGLASLPGKYLIFGGLSKELPLGPGTIGVLAAFVDVATALTFAVGLGWLARFAWVERTLKRVHDRAQEVLAEYPRIRRMAFWGVVLFVFLPLPASGSIGGTFVGQFVGLSRTAGVVAVTLGGILVSIVFVVLARVMGAEAQRMLENPWVAGVSLIAFSAFVWVAWRRTRALLRRG